MALNRDQILQKALVRTEAVEVAALGGCVNVRGMTGSEVIAMSKEFGSGDNADFPILVYCVTDDTGNPLFTSADVPALVAMPTEITLPLLTVAKRLSGLGAEIPKATGANS